MKSSRLGRGPNDEANVYSRAHLGWDLHACIHICDLFLEKQYKELCSPDSDALLLIEALLQSSPSEHAHTLYPKEILDSEININAVVKRYEELLLRLKNEADSCVQYKKILLPFFFPGQVNHAGYAYIDLQEGILVIGEPYNSPLYTQRINQYINSIKSVFPNLKKIIIFKHQFQEDSDTFSCVRLSVDILVHFAKSKSSVEDAMQAFKLRKNDPRKLCEDQRKAILAFRKKLMQLQESINKQNALAEVCNALEITPSIPDKTKFRDFLSRALGNVRLPIVDFVALLRDKSVTDQTKARIQRCFTNTNFASKIDYDEDMYFDKPELAYPYMAEVYELSDALTDAAVQQIGHQTRAEFERTQPEKQPKKEKKVEKQEVLGVKGGATFEASDKTTKSTEQAQQQEHEEKQTGCVELFNLGNKVFNAIAGVAVLGSTLGFVVMVTSLFSNISVKNVTLGFLTGKFNFEITKSNPNPEITTSKPHNSAETLPSSLPHIYFSLIH